MCRDFKLISSLIKGPYALFDPTEFQPLDPTQEPIFPAELMVSKTLRTMFIAAFNYLPHRLPRSLLLYTLEQTGYSGFVQTLYINCSLLKQTIKIKLELLLAIQRLVCFLKVLKKLTTCCNKL